MSLCSALEIRLESASCIDPSCNSLEPNRILSNRFILCHLTMDDHRIDAAGLFYIPPAQGPVFLVATCLHVGCSLTRPGCDSEALQRGKLDHFEHHLQDRLGR